MNGEEFEKKRDILFKEIGSSDKLNQRIKDRIKDLYGSRGEKAIEIVENEKVERRNGRWFVEGSEDEYEIVKSQCSCYDYVLNVVTGKAEVDMCYHALAKKIKELLDS